MIIIELLKESKLTYFDLVSFSLEREMLLMRFGHTVCDNKNQTGYNAD